MSGLSILGVEEEDELPRRQRSNRSPRRHRRRKHTRKPLGTVITMLLIVVIVGVAGYGGRALWNRYAVVQDYEGEGEGSVTVEVKKGDSSTDIATTLENSSVIKSSRAFLDAARKEERAQTIQPGFYTVRKHMSGASALALLLDPTTRVGRITVPEGLTVRETLALLAEKTDLPIGELEEAAANTAALGLPDMAQGNLEGFLFPTTYDFPKEISAVDALRRMVEKAGQQFAAAGLDQGTSLESRSPYEIVIMASLIEQEGITSDFAKISRVIYNRLAQEMPLQFDSSINYALGRNDIRLSTQDTMLDSPYNTYQVQGLTPTPISNPGENALQAAMNPEVGDWLYFVKANKDGTSAFAVTLAEHEANVARSQEEGVY